MMEQLGKIVALAGLVLAVVGGVLYVMGRTGFRGLPGDIRYETGNVRVYFPIVTSIVRDPTSAANVPADCYRWRKN